ncbi:acyltransferase domain-containing protein [Actinomadura barringtoniae]|uniref:[acyl-carrier-protein] S-malonyltransferase n=1 Tax=Actinomadura barringtoniae TaxID=1427535 RepID=A0A939PRY9_9ACTN|nr:acyltransferase domain-containing protein [Actinomadura barringtoniae]MBO2455163.1 acyltransferase domain-containing protein [Actinomadura barringtoniae]
MPEMELANGPVVLFPGQDGYDGAALRLAHHSHSQVRDVFARIDRVTVELFERRLSGVLFGDQAVELIVLQHGDPWVSQLAIYGAGMAAHQVLSSHGVCPAALMGHGLGEITAMVAAGAITVEDGARIVIRRTQLLAESGAADGALIAVAADPDRVAHLVGLIGHRLLAVAGETHDGRTLLSGPPHVIEQVRAAASAARLGWADLEAPFLVHNPALVPELANFARGIPRRPLAVPVYSPILERFYDPDADLADLLADHLTLPVQFSTAVRALYGRGKRVFVEAGGRATLSTLVSKALHGIAGNDLSILSTLSLTRDNRLRLPETLTLLQAAGLASTDDLDFVRTHLVPEVTQDEFAAFWAEARNEVVRLATQRLAAFQASRKTVDNGA